MSGQMTGQTMSVAEFAARIGRAERQVRRYVARGEIRTTTEEVNGRSVVRIPEDEARRFLDGGASFGPDGPDLDEGLSGQVFDGPDTASGQPALREDANTRSDGGGALVAQAVIVEEPGSGPDGAGVEGTSGHPVVEVSGRSGLGPDGQVVTAAEILARYEAAAMRLGWVQGQLEMTQKMLGDGGQRVEEMRRQEDELRRRLEAESEARRQAEARASEAQAKLDAMEAMVSRSWWHKLFKPL